MVSASASKKVEISLDYACFGATTGIPLLLIMGLATQRTAWPMAWIDALVARGFYVITFDNRDIGLSSRLDDLGTPKLARVMLRRFIGLGAPPPYTLDDMADDTRSLLDLPSGRVCSSKTTPQEVGASGKTSVLYINTFGPH